MYTVYKYKFALLVGLVLSSLTLSAQVRMADNTVLSSAPSSSAFLDASSTNTWNATTNRGKGLVFPRVDLTTFVAFNYTGTAGVASNYPTRFDGMIVYNTATSGVAGVGSTQGTLTPGFWYYDNKSTSSLAGGTWRPLGQTSVVSLTSATAPAGNTLGQVAYNTSSVAPTGLVYWDGTKWVPVNQTSTITLTSASAPAGTTVGQVAYNNSATVEPKGLVYWDGTQWKPIGGDPVIGNEVLNATTNKGLSRAGAGTSADPYTLGLIDGTATNQTMVWDGTKWTPGATGLTTTALTSATTPAGLNVGDMRYNTSAAGGVPVGPVYWDGAKWVPVNQTSTITLTSASAPAGTTVGQVAYNNSATVEPKGLVYWDGTQWKPVGGDPVIGNEVLNATTNKGLSRAGAGTSADPYTLGLIDGTATNQTMVWDGTKWTPGATGLTTTALTSATTPAGLNVGDMRYNTSAAGGVPVGPVYWDGAKWVPVNQTSTITLTSASAPAGTTVGQVAYNNSATVEPKGLVYWDGTQWKPVGGDPVIGNEVLNATANKGLSRAGSGTSADPYTLGLTDGTANGQVMMWDGTKWALSASNIIYKGRVLCDGNSTQIVTNANVTATATIILTYEDPAKGPVVSLAVGDRATGTFSVVFGAVPPTTAYINYTILP